MFTMDSEAFRKDLARAISTLPPHVTTALKRTALYAAAVARTSRLYKSHTGGLRNSIKGSLVSPTQSQTSASAKYAGYVENGTPPHFIRKNKAAGKPLVFMQNGVKRWAKWVYHKGTKSRPFMQEARDKAEPLFERLCKEAVGSMFA